MVLENFQGTLSRKILHKCITMSYDILGHQHTGKKKNEKLHPK